MENQIDPSLKTLEEKYEPSFMDTDKDGAKDTESKNSEGSSVLKDFAKTSTAAKLGGTVIGASGFMKRVLGELVQDPELKIEGEKQELKGKLYKLVGLFREAKEDVVKKVQETKSEAKKIVVKHSANFLTGTTNLIEDFRDLLKK